MALLSGTWFCLTAVTGLLAAVTALLCLCECDAVTYVLGEKEGYFKGKTAWVTGGSSGVGRSIALALVRRSCGVIVLSARRVEQLNEVAMECKQLATSLNLSLTVHIVSFDMAKYDEIDKAVESVKHLTGGHIDLLFNNAGITQRGVLSAFDVDASIMNINFLSQLRLTKAVLSLRPLHQPPPEDGLPTPHPLHIVVTGSMQSRMPVPSRAAYCASKSAMHSYFAALQHEADALGLNLRITQCLLGYIATDISLNALLADGSHPPSKDPNHSGRRVMPPDRAADLMLASTSRNLREPWISTQPILSYMYLYYYAPMLIGVTGLEGRSLKKVVHSDLAYTKQKLEWTKGT